MFVGGGAASWETVSGGAGRGGVTHTPRPRSFIAPRQTLIRGNAVQWQHPSAAAPHSGSGRNNHRRGGSGYAGGRSQLLLLHIQLF